MPKLNPQEGFNFKNSIFSEKRSYTEYTPMQIKDLEMRISKAHMNRENLSPDLLHYLLLKNIAENKK